ncbi:hypothetical protein FHS60_001018 [Alloprevotella rava]|uniref:Uncharacterized protein n=1 Tax=Alloprevotella rava TaxID=671218 RepID=A0A7W5XXU5_9BACT|nr:hypothetical protein [Alloprevotella rava]
MDDREDSRIGRRKRFEKLKKSIKDEEGAE